MILENNTERVMNLVDMINDLNGIDKVRLAIHILEDLGFIPIYDITNFIEILNIYFSKVYEIICIRKEKVFSRNVI